jgi:hypothetical protein
VLLEGSNPIQCVTTTETYENILLDWKNSYSWSTL